MNPNASSCRTLAFTLVEMLTVIAIIGILAAILLPVLNKAELRAKRILCVNDLGQVGLAFHTFSNDHNGKYPMAISTNDGGSLEYVEGGFAAGSEFYTAFRNFQPLSNALVHPELLICPTDVRTPTNFESLQNCNLSYFVGVEATFDKPGSILAGDQNLVTNGFGWSAFIVPFPAPYLAWWSTMHQAKGNVVFADGHVEQWNNASLAVGEGMSPFNQSFFMPVCPPPAGDVSLPSVVHSGPSDSGPSGSGSSGTGPTSPSYPPSQPAPEQLASSAPGQPGMQPAPSPSGSSPAGQEAPFNPFGDRINQTETLSQTQLFVAIKTEVTGQATNAVVSIEDTNSAMSPFDRHMTMVMRNSLLWLYILLCILVLLYLLNRLRKKLVKKWDEQDREI
jgi:prepilin-type N-terminal cleavage/methylation domain-containing protein/prepilin-type processing-associated H-X9-DG protein